MVKKQMGTVLVFRPDVTREEIQRKLEALKDILASSYYVTGKPGVYEFNPDHGGPVWYVP